MDQIPTFDPPTEARLKEIQSLLDTGSSINFTSSRAKESMRILLSEAVAARKLREEIEEDAADLRRLRALEAAGVDSWEGYDTAMEILHG